MHLYTKDGRLLVWTPGSGGRPPAEVVGARTPSAVTCVGGGGGGLVLGRGDGSVGLYRGAAQE